MVNPLIDVKVQIEVYKKYKARIFQENGKAHKCKNKIYIKLTKKLKGMSAKSIQTSINRNVKEILADDEVKEETNDNNVAYFSSSEDNAESATVGSADNGNTQYFPSEFVEVIIEENAEAADMLATDMLAADMLASDLDETNVDEIEVSYLENHKNEALVKLYHKKTIQEDLAGIKQVHESIDKLVNMYKKEIVKLNESHQHISRSFQDNRKIAEEEISRLNQKDVVSMKTMEMAKAKISELEKQKSDDRKVFDEEISRLNQKDVVSMKTMEMAKAKISELEKQKSDDRKVFDEEISRLNQKDVVSMKTMEMAKAKISELEKQKSDDRKVFDEEISRLNQKDVVSMKTMEMAKAKISELEKQKSDDRKVLKTPSEAEKSLIQSNQKGRKRSRSGTNSPTKKREKRIRKCNTLK